MSAAEVARAIEAGYGVSAGTVPLRGGRAGVAASGDGWSLVGDPAEVQAEVGRRVAGSPRGVPGHERSEALNAVDEAPLTEVTDRAAGGLTADPGVSHDLGLRGDGLPGRDGAVEDGCLKDGGNLLPLEGVGDVADAGEVERGGHGHPQTLAKGVRDVTGGHGQQ